MRCRDAASLVDDEHDGVVVRIDDRYDDWGLATLTSKQGRDILEIVDDRHGRASTILTSQLPVDHWHDLIPDSTVADDVLDRLVHTAHCLALKGESLAQAAVKTGQAWQT